MVEVVSTLRPVAPKLLRLLCVKPVVHHQVDPVRAEAPDSADNELERSIKAAMMRMKRVAAESDEEDGGEEETPSGEWDS